MRILEVVPRGSLPLFARIPDETPKYVINKQKDATESDVRNDELSQQTQWVHGYCQSVAGGHETQAWALSTTEVCETRQSLGY